MVGAIVAVVLVLFAIFVAAKTIRIIPQARAGVVERLGRYSRTLSPGMTIVVPFIDRVRPLLDLREQVVTFPPQPVITADNVSVHHPDVSFVRPCNLCPHMKRITLANIRAALEGMRHEVTIDPAIAGRARLAVERMLALK